MNSAPAYPRMPLRSSLSFGCLLGWISLNIASMDQPWLYAHTPLICLGFLAGIAIGFSPVPLKGRSITSWHVVSLGVCGAAANALAAACPVEQVQVALLVFTNALPGVLARYWATELVTAPKGRIMPFVAIGGLVSSVLLAAPALYDHATQALLVAVPLLASVLMHAADMRGEALGRTEAATRDGGEAPAHDGPAGAGNAEEEPARDMRHTSWPLPTAILACACLSSCFVGLLSYPFLVMARDAELFASVFGSFLFAAMAAWSTFSRRRNVNGFLIVTMFAMEMALLAFAAGILERVYLPIIAIAAVGNAVSVLLWVMATLLSRSQNAHAPYRLVFAVFLGLGTGAFGRGVGFAAATGVDIPFSHAQALGAVLFAVLAIVLVVLSGVELIVMRNNLESHHANDVAAVRSEAAREVEDVRSEAAQQVEMVKDQASREVEEIREETAERVAALMRDAEAQMQEVLAHADKRVAEIQKQANAGMKASIRESCHAIAERYELTQREAEAIELVCDGMSRAEIARKWVVTENTVKYHMRNVYRKLDVHNSRDLIAFVEESRTIFEDDPPPKR